MTTAMLTDSQVIEVVSMLFGGAAIVVGAVTLYAVFAQIDLAREELRVVKSDVERNAVLFERGNRQSKLWPYGGLRKYRESVMASLGYYEVNLAIENTGTIVDFDRVVTIGMHESFQFVPQGESEEWKPVKLYLTGAYDEFQFYRLISAVPIYMNDSIELPLIVLRKVPLKSHDLDKFIILGRVSSKFEQNPPGNGKYFKLRSTNVTSAIIENVYREFNGRRALAFEEY